MRKVGIDIVENERVEKSMSTSFARKVLSEEEMKRFEEYKDRRKVEFLAGRFACKEAIIKCLSEYEIPELNKLNIINNESGKPEIKYKDYDLLISIAHERKYAIAIAQLQ